MALVGSSLRVDGSVGIPTPASRILGTGGTSTEQRQSWPVYGWKPAARRERAQRVAAPLDVNLAKSMLRSVFADVKHRRVLGLAKESLHDAQGMSTITDNPSTGDREGNGEDEREAEEVGREVQKEGRVNSG